MSSHDLRADEHTGHSGHAGHSHDHRGTPLKPLAAALAITFLIFIVQIIGAFFSGSLALLSDSMHMLSDSTALILALLAAWVGRQAATDRATYGHRRVEVLAALVNGLTVSVVTVWIVVQAVLRISSDHNEIDSVLMAVVAVIGLLANAVSAAILWRHQGDGLNIRAAFLHVLADLLGSVFVIIAAVVIYFTGLVFADTLASLAIVAMVLPRALRLMWESLEVLLERAPRGIDTEEVRETLLSLDGVLDIHDLHIWSTDGTTPLATCHVVVDTRVEDLGGAVLDRVQHALMELGIDHSTIQLEEPGHLAHEHSCD